ncbi:MAG: hypothetical protein ACXABY_00130 [Candidatus Thorarchaeota archaeon]|jgi:hypothetical protein
MSNKILNNSTLSAEKLRSSLEQLRHRSANRNALSEILGEALAVFKRFYQEMGDPEFTPHPLETGDTPRSETYNLNFSQISSDVSRFYSDVEALADAQLKSFNYAKIANEELVKRADALASMVLDLKILSDFTRGDVLIAGDDFRTLDSVDLNIATGSAKAEKMFGAGGMSLKRKDNRNLVDATTNVEVFPLAPTTSNDSSEVNRQPTPGNLKRFYEGNYYNFMGQARPEGGQFNIKFLLKPVEGTEPVRTDDTKVTGKRTTTTTTVIDDSSQYANENAGYFVELGASEEDRVIARTKMFDGDPSTFWEAEYVYHINSPLIDDIIDETSVESDSNTDEKGHKDNLPRTVSVVVDFKEAERVAKSYDFDGRDLIADMVITFNDQVPINYLIIDPILFGSNAFIEVLDVSTASEEEGQFVSVDGWNNVRYAKTITPEANEFLNDVQVGQLLSPSRFEYTGKGVFPFPTRIARRLKVRLKMDNPVPTPYERYYVLMRNQLDTNITVRTSTTRGLFR